MKIRCVVIEAEGDEEVMRGALSSIAGLFGPATQVPTDGIRPAIEEQEAEEEEEEEDLATWRAKHYPPREKQKKPPTPRVGNGMAVDTPSPAFRSHSYSRKPGARSPLEWETCKLTKAKQNLGACELCTKQIETDQFYRAPVTNPTRRAHDDCVQARADERLKD